MQTCHLVILFVLPLSILGWNQISGSELEKALGSDGPKLIASGLEAEWLQAASEAPGSLLAVDCSNHENDNFCASHAGASYPAIRLFQDASPGSIYQGPKTAKPIINFLARHRRPLVSKLTTPDEYSALLTADEAVFIAYAPTQEQRALIQYAAVRYRDEFTFGLVANPALIPGEATESPPIPVVLCHRSNDAATSRLPLAEDSSTPKSSDDLAAFIEEASRPTIAELTVSTHARSLARGAPIVYIFAQTTAERASLRTSLHRLATGYRDSLTIVTVNPAEFPDLPGKLGLCGAAAGDEIVEGRPAGALHQLSKDRVYPYPCGRPVDPRSIQQWGLDVFQGRVKPWTPPGVTTSYDDLGPTRVAAAATRKISIANIPGLKIKIAGHRQDEL
ncbi:hypothetical protein MCOR27_003702 [Pyricularia oryzae]|uniref:protein disulfide-isomerase n=1 Tax=Pyricularia grisea TaxID=148305 RepID=A0ABQ8NAE5_PYRGI|nr:hypothetical protein MCOR27_003702 [Pyricularia oryzae]KAI6293012.1 hypothetical protein MCOR33_009434 [Pyricularia grisea]KAI6341032.1 hypothetical protein MCOR28_006215 [Pyricularia oryzae]KAI6341754.1 hypothetical protein MCOR30_001995 [Pyricularia oryzae]KAI6377024.1 hypothetical protein MCOR32_004929 [Pyricularia oryzae]